MFDQRCLPAPEAPNRPVRGLAFERSLQRKFAELLGDVARSMLVAVQACVARPPNHSERPAPPPRSQRRSADQPSAADIAVRGLISE